MSEVNIISSIRRIQLYSFDFYKIVKECVMTNLQIQKVKSSMEAEILDQPRILDIILKNYIASDGYIILNAPSTIEKIVLVASGSSYHCARFSAELFGEIASIEARSIY